jgi:uncharacterized coiled-coil DUF342 family protein
MKTRKELANEVARVQAQLQAHQHATRSGLNAHVQRVERECVELTQAKTSLEGKLQTMQAERDELVKLCKQQGEVIAHQITQLDTHRDVTKQALDAVAHAARATPA